jgi:hypothetical protein
MKCFKHFCRSLQLYRSQESPDDQIWPDSLFNYLSFLENDVVEDVRVLCNNEDITLRYVSWQKCFSYTVLIKKL